MFTMFALSLLSPAQAQSAADWTIEPTVLLTGADVPWGSTIGSPSVVYDSNADRYLMFYESFIGATANCPAGEWGIGQATSPDGINWTAGGSALIDPNPASGSPNYYSCVAAHPGAIYLPPSPPLAPGGTVYLYFKAEQASDACTVLPSAPTWGCGQYTGVGLSRIRLNASGTIRNTMIAPTPVLAKSVNFGYPKPIRFGTKAVLSYTQYPDVRLATSTNPLGPFSDLGVALAQATHQPMSSWVDDEFYNAAITCRDSGSYPLELFAGSRDTNFGIVLTGAVGKAVAAPNNISAWALDASPQFAYSGDASFRHWDVLRVDVPPSSTHYLMYYDEKDGSGNNQIRMATTLPSFSWTNSQVYDKACP